MTAESTKAHCNRCQGSKHHAVVHVEKTGWQEVLDDDEGVCIDGGDQWTLLRCLGCDAVRLKHQHWFSEDMDERGRPNVYTEWFPPSINRQKPKWRREFIGAWDTTLHSYNELCDEIYGALAIGAHRVATMGIRALVERLMIEEVTDKGTFEKNIQAFFDAGYVALRQQTMFRDTLIEAGHAAMHRDFHPSAETVNILLDIVEGILDTTYYQPLLAARVKKTIPKRK